MASGAAMRLDKWLWYARFFKTRVLATSEVAAGHIRVNGARVTRPAQLVGPGDTLTLIRGGQVHLVRVLSLGLRRGPAVEAQMLYYDLEAAPASDRRASDVGGASALE